MPEDRRERRERIARELKRDPQQSDRTIAKATGASPSTVGTERKEQEQIGVVSKLDTRIGKDGVAQPAHKPPIHRQPPAAAVRNTTPNPAAPLSKEQQLRAMREHPRTPAALVSNTAAPLLLARQIEDFCSGLKGRRTDVERIDTQLRLRLARGLLAALVIDPAELASGGSP
jgi:DNA-binding Lrp family transcriptional regulator